MTIGQRIKIKRETAGMTLESLGKKVGVAAQTLSRYETGAITGIPMKRIEAIAEALDTTPAYLMGWEDELAPMTPEGQKKFDELNEIFGGAFSKLSLDKQILIQKIVQMDDETIAALNQIADQIIARR